jgi:hypothetical protein
MSDVDRLREDIDRAEAQTAHLEARLAATTEPAP